MKSVSRRLYPTLTAVTRTSRRLVGSPGHSEVLMPLEGGGGFFCFFSRLVSGFPRAPARLVPPPSQAFASARGAAGSPRREREKTVTRCSYPFRVHDAPCIDSRGRPPFPHCFLTETIVPPGALHPKGRGEFRMFAGGFFAFVLRLIDREWSARALLSGAMK